MKRFFKVSIPAPVVGLVAIFFSLTGNVLSAQLLPESWLSILVRLLFLAPGAFGLVVFLRALTARQAPSGKMPHVMRPMLAGVAFWLVGLFLGVCLVIHDITSGLYPWLAVAILLAAFGWLGLTGLHATKIDRR